MFFDVVDLTMTYIQYIALLINLSSESLPSFFMGPLDIIQYALLDVYSGMKQEERYDNPLRVELPSWFPLDIRLQFVCAAVIAPLALSTIGLLFVYGKPVYLWFLCVLTTLFMFLFGFIVLANVDFFTAPGSSLPPKTTLGILSGVGLPCFALLLVVGLLCMGRARLRRLRNDAVELGRLIDEEQQRRQRQRITQQLVDRQGINLVAVAAERVHAKNREFNIAHLDIEDVLLQGGFVVLLLIGSLVLLGAISIPAIHDMQQSVVFRAFGGITLVICALATLWWAMSLFTKGRRFLYTCRAALDANALDIIVMVASFLYINVVTNFIYIVQCVPVTCAAGSRLSHAASLYPKSHDTEKAFATDRSSASPATWCLSCNFDQYAQRCPAAFQQSLCATSHQQPRLAYDPRVPCEGVDGFFLAGGVLILIFYVLFLPYLHFYVAQYGVRMLRDAYPLEQRYYKVFTPEELHLQKVLVSGNSAAFAYRAYKPQFRFYRLTFLLQKIILAVVGCVMQRGQDHNTAWVGMLFFVVVPLIALCCAVYLRPFSQPTEAIYFPALQAMVSVLGVVALVSWSLGRDAVPFAVWVTLLVALIGVPVISLVVGTVLSLRKERRWADLLEKQLVQEVTDACEQKTQSRRPSPLSKPCDVKAADMAEGAASSAEVGISAKDGLPPLYSQTRSPGSLEGHRDDGETRRWGPDDPSRSPLPPSSATTAGIVSVSPAEVAVPPQSGDPTSASLDPTPKCNSLSPAALTAGHPNPAIGKSPPPLVPPEPSRDLQRFSACGAPGIASSWSRMQTSDRTTPALFSTPAINHDTTSPPHASLRSTRSVDTRQELPALFNARTLLDSLKALCAIAVESMAAPFLLFRGCDQQQQQQQQLHHHSVGGHSGVISTAPGVDTPTECQVHQRCRSTITVAASSIQCLAPLLQPSGVTIAANPASGKACDSGSGATLDTSAGRVSKERSRQNSKGSSRLHQHRGSHGTNAVRTDAGRYPADRSHNRHPVSTPSGNSLPRQRGRGGTSSLRGYTLEVQVNPLSYGPSLQTLGNRTGTQPPPPSPLMRANTGALSPNSLPPPLLPATNEIPVPITPRHPHQVQLSPRHHRHPSRSSTSNGEGDGDNSHEAPPKQRHPQPETFQERSEGLSPPRCEGISTTDTTAGEYALEATEAFVPSLYFARRVRATWWFTNALLHLYSASWRKSSSLAVPRSDVPLPGQRTLVGEARAVTQPLQQQVLIPSCSPPVDSAATDGVGTLRSAPSPIERIRTHSPDYKAAPNALQRIPTDPSRGGGLSRSPLRGGARVECDCNEPTSRRGAVLSFAKVCLRRQACPHDAVKSGLPRLCTAQELQQRRQEVTRKAFWANPTDAMFGVVDVPGSMTPWVLFCSVRLTSTSSASAARSADQRLQPPSSPRTMLSLQRQYYVQLMEQQHSAETPTNATDEVRERRYGSHTFPPPASQLDRCPLFSSGVDPSLPNNPVREAAHERQAVAMRCQQKCCKEMGFVPLDTDMHKAHVPDKRCGYSGVSGNLCVEGEQRAGLEGRLHWLEQWGPLLMELLHESAQDDNIAPAINWGRTCYNAGGSSRSRSTGSTSSSDTTGTNGSYSAPATKRSARATSSSGGTEQGQQRRPQGASRVWWTCLLPSNWLLASKEMVRRLTNGNDKVRHQRTPSRSPAMSDVVSREEGGRRHTPPSPRPLSVAGQQPSMLLSLIAGNIPPHTTMPASPLEAAPQNHATTAPLADIPYCTTSSHDNFFFPSHPSLSRESSVGSADGATERHQLGQRTAHTPQNYLLSNAATAPTTMTREPHPTTCSPLSQAAGPLPRPESECGSTPESQVHSSTPADPLIQQYRCLYLLRGRLKESYWEHRKQLTTVQSYIDYEINGAVRRVLTFLLMVIGVVATIALTLSFCGMLHVVDWTFISGVRRADANLRYELAGYDSWDSFTRNCCCTAATQTNAHYPYYALDVESWMCVNGVTKERLRRDGYDNAIKDGYAVRELCAMEFKNSCTLVVSRGKVTLEGCNASAVSEDAIVRW
ncbi:hypothetical protein JKF63_07653 [Porcisia hertigi]|uniref:Uncharacterized protein n=1 Tax=Porcisia hertigi TaxID=2761500 RepID=A0A836IZA4_9TRYP|nr:hypothetical protein JKF63_07653 [Porcisia hertigi]